MATKNELAIKKALALLEDQEVMESVRGLPIIYALLETDYKPAIEKALKLLDDPEMANKLVGFHFLFMKKAVLEAKVKYFKDKVLGCLGGWHFSTAMSMFTSSADKQEVKFEEVSNVVTFTAVQQQNPSDLNAALQSMDLTEMFQGNNNLTTTSANFNNRQEAETAEVSFNDEQFLPTVGTGKSQSNSLQK